jgi:hypothetical protein
MQAETRFLAIVFSGAGRNDRNDPSPRYHAGEPIAGKAADSSAGGGSAVE